MPAKRKAFSVDHPIVMTFLIFAVIAFMSLASEVLKPLALAVLLSFALTPISAFIERRGLPRTPAVILTMLLVIGTLGGVGYKVGQEFGKLAKNLPRYTENIKKKAAGIQTRQEGVIDKAKSAASEVTKSLEKPNLQDAVKVNVVSQPSFQQRLQSTVGPYLEGLGVGAFVLILVLFILMNREDMSDRIIRLFGLGRMSLTTKTMEEVGMRISRYLTMFCTVNASVGLIVGLGLWAIGVEYALLWGVLAGLLRFIPYAGPATAFALPLIFSIADFPTWREPLMVIGLFVTLEVVANSFLEPIIYGKTTGVSALGLLVAAMFWTWLWGALGLLLSTPMTVCLAVLGKSVPGLHFFATLLGEEPALEADVKFYQRLLAMDQDDAWTIIEAALKQEPRAKVFDEILVPTLSRVERDFNRDDVDDRERAFVWRFISDLLDDLEQAPEVDLKSLSTEGDAKLPSTVPAEPLGKVLGVATGDKADELVLRMLSLLLTPAKCPVEILPTPESALKLAEAVAEAEPHIAVLSYVPPGGLTSARYLVRRLRAGHPNLTLLVGHWGEIGKTTEATERLTGAGASQVVFRLADARDHILDQLKPKTDEKAAFGNTARPLSPAVTP